MNFLKINLQDILSNDHTGSGTVAPIDLSTVMITSLLDGTVINATIGSGIINLAHGTIDLNGVYKANPGFNGYEYFKYTFVNNGSVSNEANVIIKVSGKSADYQPFVQNAVFYTTVNTPIEVNFNNMFHDIEGSSIGALGMIPTYLNDYSFDDINNISIIRPYIGFIGTAYLDIYVMDMNPSNGALVLNKITITLHVVPDLTGLEGVTDDFVKTDIYSPVTIDVLSNDGVNGLGAAGTPQIETQPTYGTVTIVDNKIVYTPSLSYGGVDKFTYSINGSEAATVTIFVENTKPQAITDEYSTGVDTSLDIAVKNGLDGILDNDVDLDDNNLLLANVDSTSAMGGTVSISSDGTTINYIPPSGFIGKDYFTYTISDGNNGFSTQTVIIDVGGPSSIMPPIAQNDLFETTVDTNLTMTLEELLINDSDGNSDPAGVNLLLIEKTSPTDGAVIETHFGGMIYITSNTWTYVPKPGFVGTDSFEYTVQNNEGLIHIGRVDINVVAVEVPVVTVSPLDSTPVLEGFSSQITVNLSIPSDTDTIITFTVSGTATINEDYSFDNSVHMGGNVGTVVIPAGQTSVIISLSLINDNIIESLETIQFTITDVDGNPNIILGDANDLTTTVNIEESRASQLIIVASDTLVAEGSGYTYIQVSIGIPSSTDIVVTFTLDGTAEYGVDYEFDSNSLVTVNGNIATVTIPAGQAGLALPMYISSNDFIENNKTIIFTITDIDGNPANITLGSDQDITATITIEETGTTEVTITAPTTTLVAEGGSTNFTLDLGVPSSTDLVVTFTLGGTAEYGVDYEFDSSAGVTVNGNIATVTIPAGQTSLTLPVNILTDNVIENNETIIFTVTDVDGNPNITLGSTQDLSATITIEETNTAQVTITAPPITLVAEGGSTNFTIDLGVPSSTDLIVTFTLGGTAQYGVDYEFDSSVSVSVNGNIATVTIPAGQTGLTLPVNILTDNVIENNETIIFTVTDVDGNTNITLGNAQYLTASITIEEADSAEVTITAPTTTLIAEGGSTNFTIDLGIPSSTDIVVTFTIDGTAEYGIDYEFDSSAAVNVNGNIATVTLPAGQTNLFLPVHILTDNIIENNETIVITITDIDGNPANITLGNAQYLTTSITIEEADSAEVTIIAPTTTLIAEGGSTNFTIDLGVPSSTDLTVTFTLGGTAEYGIDYEFDSSAGVTVNGNVATVTIPAGQTSLTLPVNILTDNIIENNETIIFTVTDVDGNPNITLGSAQDLTATITIEETDTTEVTITAPTTTLVAEGGSTNFTIDLGVPSSTDLVVTFTLGGTAQYGVDYVFGGSLPVSVNGNIATVTIPAGQTGLTLPVNILTDNVIENNETIIFTITDVDGNPNITLGSTQDLSATITIEEADSAEVTITAPTTTLIAEGGSTNFTIDLGVPSSTDLTVTFTLGGTAEYGVDYEFDSSAAVNVNGNVATVTIPAGQTSLTLPVNILTDNVIENNETIIFTVTDVDGNPNITLGSVQDLTATITIEETDTAEVTITAPPITLVAEGGSTSFTIDLGVTSSTDLVVTFTLGGTEQYGVDYEFDSSVLVSINGNVATVTIPAGQTGLTLPVNILTDNVIENNETIIFTVTDVDGNPNITLGSTQDLSATITIEETDTAQVTITAPTTTLVAEGGSTNFTIDLGVPSSTDLIVTFTLGGTAQYGVDYEFDSSVSVSVNGNIATVTIPAGQTGLTLPVNILTDNIIENNETIIFTVTDVDGNPNITLGSTQDLTAVITIEDYTPSASLSMNVINPNIHENTSNNYGYIQFQLSHISTTDTVIEFELSGAATAGVDYELVPTTVTIPAGSLTITIEIKPIDDSIYEGNESIVVIFKNIISGDNFDTTNINPVTLNIIDNDSPSSAPSTLAPGTDIDYMAAQQYVIQDHVIRYSDLLRVVDKTLGLKYSLPEVEFLTTITISTKNATLLTTMFDVNENKYIQNTNNNLSTIVIEHTELPLAFEKMLDTHTNSYETFNDNKALFDFDIEVKLLPTQAQPIDINDQDIALNELNRLSTDETSETFYEMLKNKIQQIWNKYIT